MRSMEKLKILSMVEISFSTEFRYLYLAKIDPSINYQESSIEVLRVAHSIEFFMMINRIIQFLTSKHAVET